MDSLSIYCILIVLNISSTDEFSFPHSIFTTTCKPRKLVALETIKKERIIQIPLKIICFGKRFNEAANN